MPHPLFNRAALAALIALGGMVNAEPVLVTDADAKHPLAGGWSGPIRAGDATEELVLHFEPRADGQLAAHVDLAVTNIRNIALGPVKRDRNEYRFHDFHAVLADGGTTLTGYLPFYSRRLEFSLTKGRLPTPPPPSPAPVRTAQPLWTFDAGAPVWSTAAVAGSEVYFGSNDGKLHALDIATGRRAWAFTTKGPVVARPLIAGRYIYVASDDGFLYKLALADRAVAWRFDTHGGAVQRVWPDKEQEGYDYQASAPVLADGMVYIGSADGHVYAIDDRTGAERWRFKTGGIVRSTPGIAADRLVAASFDGSIYALDRATGRLLWKQATGDAVNSSPAISEGVAYIGSRSTDVYALDLRDGTARWKYFYWMSWVESSPVVREGTVYVGSSDYQRVYALDGATGKPRWWFDTDGSAWSTPAVTGDSVYIGAVGTVGYMTDHQGGFFALDRATGKERWRFALPPIKDGFTSGVASSPTVAQGRVFFGSLDGRFFAFEAT